MIEAVEAAWRHAGDVAAIGRVDREDRRAEAARGQLPLDDESGPVRGVLHPVIPGLLEPDGVSDLAQAGSVDADLPDADVRGEGVDDATRRHHESDPLAVGRPGRRLDARLRCRDLVRIRAI